MTPVSAAGNAHSKVGPHEYFSATVNGSSGVKAPAKIAVACAGPSETGHPLAGQTVGVTLVPVPSTAAKVLGYTGDFGASIGAFFGAPPPGSAPSPVYVNFGVYRVKPIPTSLELPCSGEKWVTFVPLPNVPPSQSLAVPVEFVSEGV
jgi:hypothetical protein